ncbi:MAG: 2-amino-4-hydroxy-6-hydroxymethyldihydropteridine diphosphokinase [Prevotellaceae bacterium]|jgi:2-amino-4-hydroxy-6-hydroxymethyldihydropteridine diphosphokinase|nr:2-amino-4-hydroxy-6-hydroxymethyldihydropteridine diphosphokinase [Prevotellaceae bacterium]
MNYYLGLGTNLGRKEENLRTAVDYIAARIGRVIALSAFYATAPWGFASANKFLNAALCVESSLAPEEVLRRTQTIEQAMGRSGKSSHGVYRDRLIDIDLLLCDGWVIDTPTLQLPHRLMHLRGFVLQPLCEIAPDVIHPLLDKSVRQLCDEMAPAAPLPIANYPTSNL